MELDTGNTIVTQHNLCFEATHIPVGERVKSSGNLNACDKHELRVMWVLIRGVCNAAFGGGELAP